MSLRQFDDGMTMRALGGRRLVTLDWALAQAVPELPRENALAVLDSALHLGAISARGLEVAHDMSRGRRGVARTHDLWEVADGRAESPLESFGRLDCLDAGSRRRRCSFRSSIRAVTHPPGGHGVAARRWPVARG
ncbi:hypothetical protein NKG05_15360 [Oerskovia sp. M15]